MTTYNNKALRNLFANYAREIEEHWKYKETQRKPIFLKSPQLHLRSHLVEWLRNVSEKVSVSYRTIHLAVYILDTFMDNHSITKDRLGFVALVCLMLAAKFEELDSKIPLIPELNKFDGNRFSVRDFISVEVMVLKFLDFELMQPTMAHFAEYYTMGIIIPSDFQPPMTYYSIRSMGETACNMVAELMDVCLKEVKFMQHRPSILAAACIMTARKRLNLVPWNETLIYITGYKEENLIPFFNLLMDKVRQENLRRRQCVNSPDHGYLSDVS